MLGAGRIVVGAGRAASRVSGKRPTDRQRSTDAGLVEQAAGDLVGVLDQAAGREPGRDVLDVAGQQGRPVAGWRPRRSPGAGRSPPGGRRGPAGCTATGRRVRSPCGPARSARPATGPRGPSSSAGSGRSCANRGAARPSSASPMNSSISSVPRSCTGYGTEMAPYDWRPPTAGTGRRTRRPPTARRSAAGRTPSGRPSPGSPATASSGALRDSRRRGGTSGGRVPGTAWPPAGSCGRCRESAPDQEDVGLFAGLQHAALDVDRGQLGDDPVGPRARRRAGRRSQLDQRSPVFGASVSALVSKATGVW